MLLGRKVVPKVESRDTSPLGVASLGGWGGGEVTQSPTCITAPSSLQDTRGLGCSLVSHMGM